MDPTNYYHTGPYEGNNYSPPSMNALAFGEPTFSYHPPDDQDVPDVPRDGAANLAQLNTTYPNTSTFEGQRSVVHVHPSGVASNTGGELPTNTQQFSNRSSHDTGGNSRTTFNNSRANERTQPVNQPRSRSTPRNLSQLGGIPNVQRLEQRVTHLERSLSAVGSIEKRLAVLESQVQSLKTLEDSITKNLTQMKDLKSQIEQIMTQMFPD
ncbi:hypothetical protein LTR64_008759 [Lithohypha guttulata]|uniref:uncharacterized protein n=1 Tax=Lithohypha guttulata TaxID=1690604 RepID=UPI00315CB80E